MTVRKMVTFPDLGAELLARATAAAGRERAGGEYLTQLMAQRLRAWQRAYEGLRLDWTPDQLLGFCQQLQAHTLTVDDRLGTAVTRLLGVRLTPRQALMLCDLAEEFAAGNRELRALLGYGQTTQAKDDEA